VKGAWERGRKGKNELGKKIKKKESYMATGNPDNGGSKNEGRRGYR